MPVNTTYICIPQARTLISTNSFPHLEARGVVLELCCHSGVELHLADGATAQRGALNHLS